MAALASPCLMASTAAQSASPARRIRTAPVAHTRANVAPQLRRGPELYMKARGRESYAVSSRKACVCVAAVAEELTEELTRPPSPQTVRSMMGISNAGMLATAMVDGWPLGTHMPYILDANANPVFKLRSSAVHTENLDRDSRCSLYVRADFGARASLLGNVVELDNSEESEMLKSRFAAVHGSDFGVDAMADDDKYCTLEIEKIFYVAGLGQEKTPDTVDVESYRAAEMDPIAGVAQRLVKWMNAERGSEMKCCAKVFAGLEDVESASLLWVDAFGCDIRADLNSGEPREIRLPFERPVIDERDARSGLTMIGQLAWEIDKNYLPERGPVDFEEPEK